MCSWGLGLECKNSKGSCICEKWWLLFQSNSIRAISQVDMVVPLLEYPSRNTLFVTSLSRDTSDIHGSGFWSAVPDILLVPIAPIIFLFIAISACLRFASNTSNPLYVDLITLWNCCRFFNEYSSSHRPIFSGLWIAN